MSRQTSPVQEEELREPRGELEEWIVERTQQLRHALVTVRESEEKYRTIVESSIESIVVVRADLVLYANAAAARLTGVPPARLVGTSFSGLFHPQDQFAIVGDRAGPGPASPGPKECRIVDIRGSERWMRVQRVLIIWEREPASLYFLNDVTECKRLEESLFQTQKIDAIGQLAGTIAHDFGNYLTLMTGLIESLRAEIAETSVLADHVTALQSATSKASALTRQLLSFARKQALQPGSVDVNALILEMKPLLSRMMGRRIRLIHCLGDELGPVWADGTQIEQVVMNLCMNARDAMPDGGMLLIETSMREIPPDAHDAEKDHGTYVTLTISDTGAGMNEQTIKRIFEPFFTTKEKGKGTGLGLSAVHGIVKQSGGFITVSSEPLKGSSFTVHFPLLHAVKAP